MIKMIAGVYGLPVKQANGNIRIVGMGPDSGPFSIDPAREAELVSKGNAAYVDGEPIPSEAPEIDESLLGDTESVDEDVKRAEEEKSLEEMTAAELRELGKEYGLTFKVGTTKADMVEAIKAEWPQPAEEDAPSFDAAEAVL